jgi:glucose-1-phosphate thymidylyltransferase
VDGAQLRCWGVRSPVTKGLILAAGGSGEAFWPRGAVGSRELLPAANRPLLEHALEAMSDAGVRSVAIAVSALSNGPVREVAGDGRRHGVRVRYLPARRDSGLVDAIASAQRFLGGARCLAQRGDVVLSEGLGRLRAEAEDDDLDVLLPVERVLPGGVVGIEDEAVLRLLGGRGGELTGGRSFDALVVSDRFVVAAGSLRPGARLVTVLEQVLADGGRARTRMLTDWARRVVSRDDLLDVNRLMLERLRPDYDEAVLTDSSVQGRVSIAPTATIESTIVRGPSIIGARARLRHAYIGPYTAIGADVVVEGTEIEHSIVLSGATIQHLGRRLESSVVGHGARVFRDFALPRALRLQVADGDQISLG